MKVLESVFDLGKELSLCVVSDKKIGFVPTMGALHDGHLSLVKESCKENDVTIVSIFVNPTQFNNLLDLEKYPRTINQDLEKLKSTNVDFVFIPSVEDIYPEPDTRQFSFGELEKVMEGKFRPGHFNGVAQVVSRLFDIVKPNKAYFGEKDFQQLAIIRKMVRQYNMPVDIVPIPIVRETSGLAISSRNQRLTDYQKEKAINIYRILSESKTNSSKFSVVETKNNVVDSINKVDTLEVEYFEIVDGNTLQQISDWDQSSYAVGCIVVYCGDVRLIDNIVYKNLEG